MSSPVARRYAKALYMIGVEENRLDALTREVKNLADVVRVSPELARLLSSPVIAQETRRAVMSDILARVGVSPTARNFTLLLTDRRRHQAEQIFALNECARRAMEAEQFNAAVGAFRVIAEIGGLLRAPLKPPESVPGGRL